MPKKQLIINLSILLASIIIFLIIFEIILRFSISPKVYDMKDFVQYSDIYGWEIKPNLNKTLVIPDRTSFVETNSMGFRDYEHNISKSQNKYRIIILGDSFTWGYGVDNNQTYAKLLETYDKKIETINLGVPGYGTDQEYFTLMNKGLKYNPDLITLMYQISSDVADVNTISIGTKNILWQKPKFVVDNNGSLVLTNYPVPKEFASSETKKTSFIKSFALYGFLRDNLLSIPIIREFLIDRFHIGRYYDFEERYTIVYKIFYKLSQELAFRKIKFLVIIMPDGGQVKGIISNKSIYFMENYFKKDNIEFIDMYDRFKGKSDKFYFKIDGHINEEGNKKVAEAIYNELITSKVL